MSCCRVACTASFRTNKLTPEGKLFSVFFCWKKILNIKNANNHQTPCFGFEILHTTWPTIVRPMDMKLVNTVGNSAKEPNVFLRSSWRAKDNILSISFKRWCQRCVYSLSRHPEKPKTSIHAGLGRDLIDDDFHNNILSFLPLSGVWDL